jgi:mannitol-specific phosphotransferase system IIBC component
MHVREGIRTGVALLLALAIHAAVGCGGGTATVTTAAKPVEPTAAQIREKAAAEAAAHKEQVARTREEEKEAAQQKKQEAHERHEERVQEATESSSGGSGSSGDGQTVPSDIVNKNLKDAEAELESAGISFTTNSYGKIVILKGDWGVCSTTPGPGQSVSGTVVLNLGHFSCGA